MVKRSTIQVYYSHKNVFDHLSFPDLEKTVCVFTYVLWFDMKLLI